MKLEPSVFERMTKLELSAVQMMKRMMVLQRMSMLERRLATAEKKLRKD